MKHIHKLVGGSGPIFSSLLTLIGFEEIVTVSEVVKPSKVHNDSSFTELSAQLVDSSQSPEADPLKTALPKKVRSSNGRKPIEILRFLVNFAGHVKGNVRRCKMKCMRSVDIHDINLI